MLFFVKKEYKHTKITKPKHMKKCVIKFVLFCLFAMIMVSSFQVPRCYGEEMVEYKGEIEHIFTHCLVAFPEIAFSNTNPMSKHYKTDCITKKEFLALLNQLHINNYALINPNWIFEVENGVVVRKKLFMPKGKKPLIFSFDDVNYDQKKLKKGMVDKLILQNDVVASSTTFGDDEIVSTTNEFVPILNEFVKTHPDFSVSGAKGMICLTGYDGILGYRTQANSPNRQSEIESAKKVVEKLKSDGWVFGCHSYGHYHMKKISDEKFAAEIKKWQQEVEPIIGKTQIYIYPYGEWQILDNNAISNKHKMLVDAGFAMFCGVGMQNFLAFLPRGEQRQNQILFMDRKNIDGFTLENRKKELSELFDSDKIYDFENR